MESQINSNMNNNESGPIFMPVNENENKEGADFFKISIADINERFDSLTREGENILNNPGYEGINRNGIEATLAEAKKIREDAIEEIESIQRIN